MDKCHWICARVNNMNRSIEYYDSFGDQSCEKVCETIENFIINVNTNDEGAKDWKIMEVPQQENGYDCGIFMLKTIRCLTENKPFDYSQEQVDYMRKIIVLELKNQMLYM